MVIAFVMGLQGEELHREKLKDAELRAGDWKT